MRTTSDEAVDTTALSRSRTKDQLLGEICFLKDQKAALTQCINDRQSRLKALMAEDGDRRLKTEVGAASFYVQTVFSVHSHDQLCHLFTKKALAGICKPNKAFITAAKQLGIEVEAAITEGVDERFKVERARTKESREAQKHLIEESTAKIEEKIRAFIEAMED